MQAIRYAERTEIRLTWSSEGSPVEPVRWQDGMHSEYVSLERAVDRSLRQSASEAPVAIAVATTSWGWSEDRAAYVVCNAVFRWLEEVGSGAPSAVVVSVDAPEGSGRQAWLDALDRVSRTMTGMAGVAPQL
jgi:hypothetical protein